MSKNRTPVVITRKDKRMGWFSHLLAFAVTGGASAPISSAMAVHKASYNARTRQLQAEAEGTAPSSRRSKKDKPTFTAEELAYMKAHTARAEKTAE